MTTKNTFQRVSELNEAFGNPRGDIDNINVPVIRKQALLVLEEAVEVVEAAFGVELTISTERDAEKPEFSLKEVLDAQGDVTTVNDGVAHLLGVDGNHVYDRVHKSNMSKFITCEEEVQPALQWYYDNENVTPDDLYISGEFPIACIKVAREFVNKKGKVVPAGKFLKNMHRFAEPDFSDVKSLANSIDKITIGDNRYDPALLVQPNRHFASDNLIWAIVRAHDVKLGVDKIYDVNGKLVSWKPVSVLDESNLPELPFLWGTWQGEARVYANTFGSSVNAYNVDVACDDYIRVL